MFWFSLTVRCQDWVEPDDDDDDDNDGEEEDWVEVYLRQRAGTLGSRSKQHSWGHSPGRVQLCTQALLPMAPFPSSAPVSSSGYCIYQQL